ncbi:hypothetical protein ACIBU0_07940 [Streptomyces sp. NPDC049627]|uniref:hypothetical protein n=1 Tax=Streptomyces sp. NPDC049627 TaxID=3365595 RepID=UPI0037BADB9B
MTPANDLWAGTLAAWAEDLRRRAKGRHNMVSSALSKELADRTRLENYLETEENEAFFFFGHGSWRSLDGKDPLLDQQNIGLLSGKPVVAIACRSAQTLGKEAVEPPLGVRSYLGFSDDLAWLPERSSLFGNAVVSGLEPLLKGQTSGAARDQLKSKLEGLVHRYKYDEPRTDKFGPFIWLVAFWDSEHVRLWGDPSSTLHTEEYSEVIQSASDV